MKNKNEIVRKITFTTLSGAIIVSSVPLNVFAEVLKEELQNEGIASSTDAETVVETEESEETLQESSEKDTVSSEELQEELPLEVQKSEELSEVEELDKELTNEDEIAAIELGGENTALTETVEAGVNPLITDKASVIVTINDANLETALREALKKPTGDITQADMESLKVLSAGAKSISDLTGLEYAVNLTRLVLYNNQISDISALKSMKFLEHLNLGDNDIVDLSPLSEIYSLKEIALFEGSHHLKCSNETF